MIAKKLSIPAVTIRAWENRYGVIKPARTDGGHRVYSEDDLQALMWLKEQVVERGIPISQAAKMWKQRAETTQASKNQNKAIVTFDEMTENLYQALLQFDNVRAHAYIDLSFSMFHFEDVFHKILVPILRRVGDDWHENRVLIAQEHFISGFTKQRILEFSRLFPINRTLPKCIAFCPPNESHQMGLLMFSLFLQKKGHEVIYLGANSTFEQLLDLIRETEAQILCISLTDQRHLTETIVWLNELHEHKRNMTIVLGGMGFAELQQPWLSKVLRGNVDHWEVWYETMLKQTKNPSRIEKGDDV
jgi:DNA-binding transcriptional MerR regulator